MTPAEPPEKPGRIGALGRACCASHRVQLAAHSLIHSRPWKVSPLLVSSPNLSNGPGAAV